jgi:hypothetical protein
LNNDTRIAGAKSRKLTINGIVLGDEGAYHCYVTNTTPYSDTSEDVQLFVGSGELTFTANPQSAKVYVGDRPSFSVATTGGRGAPSYQWWFDSSPKAFVRVGGNTAVFTNTPVIEADAGEYWCDVTDARATYSSGHARLDVKPVLAFTLQPSSGTGVVGDTYTFNAAAGGGYAPLSYEWKKDGISSVLGTGLNLLLSPLELTDAGTYHAEVTDANSMVVASDDAMLTVNPATGVPVLGMIGLGLLASGLVLGGSLVVRRRK